jgi:hypothetical protein
MNMDSKQLNRIKELSGLITEGEDKTLTPSPLDGRRKQSVINYIYNKVVEKKFDGIFRDEYWEPIKKFFHELNEKSIDYELEETNYFRNKDNDTNMPNGKIFKFNLLHTDVDGKQKKIPARITATFTEKDMGPYDLTLTF